MKRKLLVSLCALLVPAAFSARNDIKLPWAGLEISCSVSQKDTPMRDYRILIIENDTLYDTIYADLALPIFIQLDLNKSYLLEFSKSGFLERHVLIETKVPIGKERRRYSYDFEIDMPFRYCDTSSYAIQPLARIIYDEQEEEFTHDEEYAKNTGNIPKVITTKDQQKEKEPASNKKSKKIARRKI